MATRHRPLEWHTGFLRKSLATALSCTSPVPERLIGPQKTFKLLLIREHKLRYGRQPNEVFWNIATGATEPPAPRGSLRNLMAKQIIPQIFGKTLFRRTFGDGHKFPDFWGAGNGLLLPSALCTALDEWAISIVPDIPDNATPAEADEWAEAPLKEWKWRVLNPDHDMLRQPFSVDPDDTRTWLDLDQQRLCFPPDAERRPAEPYLYFWHCAAVLNRYRDLFDDNIGLSNWAFKQRQGAQVIQAMRANDRLAQQEARAAVLRAKLGLPEGTRLSMADFWQEVVADVQRVSIYHLRKGMEPMDWSMEPKYLRSLAAVPPGLPTLKSRLQAPRPTEPVKPPADAVRGMPDAPKSTLVQRMWNKIVG